MNELFGLSDDDSLLNKGGRNQDSSDGGFDSNANGVNMNQCEELDDQQVDVLGFVQSNVGGSNAGENQIEDDHDSEIDVGPTTRRRFRSLDEIFNFNQSHAELKGFSKKNSNIPNYACLA